jgi:hypothetical protein
MRFSDHNSFWEKGIGAVEILENFSSGRVTDACGGHGEHSPYYHKTTDTLKRINLQTGFAITRASLAAGAGMAEPIAACFDTVPDLAVSVENHHAALSWSEVPGAVRYRIYRSSRSTSGQTPLCSAEWIPMLETNALSWIDASVIPGEKTAYRIEALAFAGGCVSASSACTVVQVPAQTLLIPWISH